MNSVVREKFNVSLNTLYGALQPIYAPVIILEIYELELVIMLFIVHSSVTLVIFDIMKPVCCRKIMA